MSSPRLIKLWRMRHGLRLVHSCCSESSPLCRAMSSTRSISIISPANRWLYGRDLLTDYLNTYIRQHLDEVIADRGRDTGPIRLLATLSSRPVDTTRPHHVVANMFMQSLRRIADSERLFARENFTRLINLVARAGKTIGNGGQEMQDRLTALLGNIQGKTDGQSDMARFMLLGLSHLRQDGW